jgi:ABC-type oligopeptide transport system substrate-binding subunit
MKRKFVLSICVAVLLAVLGSACNDDPVDPTPTPPNPASKEGIYLGVIGFNDQLYIKDITYLNSSSYQSFTNFVDNLTPGNGTA